VALSRRHGADGFSFEASGFQTAAFQKALLLRAEQLSVQGPVLVELARSGRIDELKAVSGYDGAGQIRLLRRQAAMWDLERDFVLRRLADGNIPVVLLKGAALRLTSYQDTAERSFGDLDLLVPKDFLGTAVAQLTAVGYETESEERRKLYLDHHHHLILKKRQGFVVEVHWALEATASPFKLDPAGFMREARRMTTPSGTPVSVPRPEHMVLHLAHQNLEDGFSLLRRLVDIDRVIANAADFDWEILASESRRMRVQGIVALALRLTEVLLGTTIPPGAIKTLGLSGPARVHLALLDPVGLLLDQRGQRRAVRQLLRLWCLPHLRARLRTLKEIGTGERDHPWVLGVDLKGGAATRLAALSKLVAYQAALYPAGLLRLGSRARGRKSFWGRNRAEDRAAQ
jgi:hypothetical protein